MQQVENVIKIDIMFFKTTYLFGTMVKIQVFKYKCISFNRSCFLFVLLDFLKWYVSNKLEQTLFCMQKFSKEIDPIVIWYCAVIVQKWCPVTFSLSYTQALQ